MTRSERGLPRRHARGDARGAGLPRSSALVDTTGAGDLFAAGFLFGLARGFDAVTCARLGALAAAEVIQHVGARPPVSLKDLAEQNGLPVLTLLPEHPAHAGRDSR